MRISVDKNGTLEAVADGEKLFTSQTPQLTWRYDGEEKWTVSEPDRVELIGQSEGKYKFEACFGNVFVAFEISNIDGDCIFTGELINNDEKAIELSRFSYINGKLRGQPNFFAMSVSGLNVRHFKPDDSFQTLKQYIENDTWGKWGVKWIRMNDPLHMQENWGSSTDVGIFTWAKNRELIAGFTGPGSAFGEIGYGMSREPLAIYCSVLLDGIIVTPTKHRVLETLMLTFGDSQDGLKKWAESCAKQLGSRVKEHSLVGYCSWYQFFANIKSGEFDQAIDEFASMPKTPGGKTVQLDDGYQVMPGDWRPNSKFADVWKNLPQKIEQSGSIPGIWLAPTIIYSGHDIVKNRKDMVQMLPDGKPAITFSHWKWCGEIVDERHKGDGTTWCLEIDHPESGEFIADIIKNAVAEGWRYLKLDFTHSISSARIKYDRTKTTFETLRDMYALFREAAGEEIIICACIGGNSRYALGYVDTARIGGDNMANYPMLKACLSDMLFRMFSHGLWWNADPDVFYLRTDDSELTIEENWILTGTIGLFGCVFMTSDFISQWSSEAKKRAGIFWNEDGLAVPEEIKDYWTEEKLPRAILARHKNGRVLLGVYNLTDEICDISFDINDYDQKFVFVSIKSLEGDIGIVRNDNLLIFKNMPVHSLRIVALQ